MADVAFQSVSIFCRMSDDERQPSAGSDDDELYSPGKDDDYQPSATVVCTPSTIVRRSSGRVSRKANYAEEIIDQTFVGRPGYTHFGRTRLGGDRRINYGKVSMPKEISTRVTMLNFFAAPGKKPLPLKRNAEVVTNKSCNHANRPPKKTRTKWGRPKKNVTESDKTQEMKTRVSNCKTSGALAVPPQKRSKWNGTVSTNFYACTLLLTQRITVTVHCAPCFVFVDQARCKSIDGSVHRGVWW